MAEADAPEKAVANTKVRRAFATTRVTPEEAKAVWEAMERPSDVGCARKFAAAGRRIDRNTVKKWRLNGWQRRAAPRETANPTTMAAELIDKHIPVVTGDAVSNCRALVDLSKSVKFHNLSAKASDGIRKAVAEVPAASLGMALVEQTQRALLTVGMAMQFGAFGNDPDAVGKLSVGLANATAVITDALHQAAATAIMNNKNSQPPAPPPPEPIDAETIPVPTTPQVEYLPKMAADDPLAAYLNGLTPVNAPTQ